MSLKFDVTNNAYLRSLYRGNAELSKKSERKGASKQALVHADTNALIKGAKVLTSQSYSDDEKLDTKAAKAKFYLQMKSFADSYNYTVSSTEELGTYDAKRASKDMKALRKKYKDELEDLGITFDEKGYMKMSNSSFDNISRENYEEMFGKDSEFMKDLTKISRKLNRHIDYQA